MTYDPSINFNAPIDLDPQEDHPYCSTKLFRFLFYLNNNSYEDVHYHISDKTFQQRLIYCKKFGYVEELPNKFLLTKKGLRTLLKFDCPSFKDVWRDFKDAEKAVKLI